MKNQIQEIQSQFNKVYNNMICIAVSYISYNQR